MDRQFIAQQNYEDKLNLVLEDYYRSVQETEKFWIRDNKQALKIQSLYKMFKLCKQYNREKVAAIKIERIIRGILARKQYKNRRGEKINLKNVQFFSDQAVMIQKIFRGYHKRKYVHDFYARKQFLGLLQNKNEKFLDDLQKRSQEEKIEEERRQEAIARQEFSELAKNLHHLSSTYQIPGVYNPPYVSQKPAAFNIDVETHLKATFKANYKWKPLTGEEIGKYKLRPNSGRKLQPMTQNGQTQIHAQTTLHESQRQQSIH